MTSSEISSTSWRRQSSSTRVQNPSGGGITPPAPITGSPMKAAT